MASGIKFTFKGFDLLLENIKDAGGDVDKAVESAMKQSAYTVHNKLKGEMRDAKFKEHTGVDDGLINRMPQPKIEWNGNRCSAKVGYDKGAFDPRNPSDAYEVIFLNYGTPRVKPTRFIEKAKEASAKQVKKEQKQALEKILTRTGLKNS